MKRIIDKIKNMHLKTQLKLIYLIIILVCIFVLGKVYYTVSYHNMIKGTEDACFNVVRNDTNILNLKMSKISGSSDSLVWDHDLYNVLNDQNKKDEYYFINADKKVREILGKYFNDSSIYSIDVITDGYNYGDGKIPIVNDFYYSDSEILKKARTGRGSLVWVPTYNFANVYRQPYLADAQIDYKYLYSAVREINNLNSDDIEFETNKSSKKALLLINFKPSVFNTFTDNDLEYKDAHYYVFSDDNDIVYDSKNKLLGQRQHYDWMDVVKNKNCGVYSTKINGDDMLVCYDTIKSVGWHVALTVPVKHLLVPLKEIKKYILITSAVLIFCISIAVSIISDSITRPINKLLVLMNKTGSGKFINDKQRIYGNLEMSDLFNGFNDMNNKISTLIEENYKRKIREKEATIMSLNIQLNPHFLYNTLNTINWMAIDNDQEEISRMIVDLSSMLQYTARNDEELCPFLSDLQWLKKYIAIMQMRYEDKFSVTYGIDEKLYSYRVPKLFLQPFVENAIIYGFSRIDEGGILKISGSKEGDKVCFTVEDNGCGIEEEKVRRLLKADNKSIGISNVNNRIKLLYGGEYGVKIESQLNAGTKISVFLPL